MSQSALPWIGTIAALLSAIALYGASRHCLWPRLHARLRVVGGASGALLAGISLAAWIVDQGIGAGLSIMLSIWMIALVGLPYLGWLTRSGAPPTEVPH